jgi:acyl dehydratase
MIALYFEDYTPELSFETDARTITETDVSAFVGLAGFFGPMFTNLEYVKNSAYYSGRLVPGMLTASIAEGLVLLGGSLHDRGLALMSSSIHYQKPVFAGDTIRVRISVLEAKPTSRPDRGVVTTHHEVRNQNDVTVMTYDVVRMVKTREWGDESRVVSSDDRASDQG